MQASFTLLFVYLHELLHLWFKRMMIACAHMVHVTALDIQVSLCNPMAFVLQHGGL